MPLQLLWKKNVIYFLPQVEQESLPIQNSGRNFLEKKRQKSLMMINLHFGEEKMAGMPMEHLLAVRQTNS